jgi:hypothetical protein
LVLDAPVGAIKGQDCATHLDAGSEDTPVIQDAINSAVKPVPTRPLRMDIRSEASMGFLRGGLAHWLEKRAL